MNKKELAESIEVIIHSMSIERELSGEEAREVFIDKIQELFLLNKI